MLSELIAAVIKAKRGNAEFALFYFGEPYYSDPEGVAWRAEIGNTCSAVMLGEAVGEYRAEGATAEEAVSRLLAALKDGDGPYLRGCEAARLPPPQECPYAEGSPEAEKWWDGFGDATEAMIAEGVVM